MNNKNIGILGCGEVGLSLQALYDLKGIECTVKDKLDKVEFYRLDVLNICIPYTEEFISIVKEEIKKANPALTIIHTTVPIGTTSKLDTELLSEYCIVHSPVRGNHPDLTKSLQTFAKYIGSNNPKATTLAVTHLAGLGINVTSCNSFEKTEAAKLLCTTYYGLCIAWHNEIKKVCDQFDINVEFIKNWNRSYNKGYETLGHPEFTRPILNPPIEEKIGGHCVIPNAELLNQVIDSALIKEVLKYK